jgi:hypothetical protein
MADERNEWLDKAAAEKLLRGEPVETTDEYARVQAARLSRVLYSSGRAGYAGCPDDHAGEGEMPGEAAALAAYRKARADADAPAAPLKGVRAPRPPRTGHWQVFGRPVRLGIAAAVAGCAIGGVAIAAGTGFLPPPFNGGGGGRPLPGASVSGAATPGPLVSDAATRGGLSPVSPPAPSDGTAKQGQDGKQAEAYGTSGEDCREYRSGHLTPGHRRRLEAAAKGAGRVEKFCAQALGDAQAAAGDEDSVDARGTETTKPGKATGAGKAKAGKSRTPEPRPGKSKTPKPQPKPKPGKSKPAPSKSKPAPAKSKPAKPAKNGF